MGLTSTEPHTRPQQDLYKPITLSKHPGLLPWAFSGGPCRETQGNAWHEEVGAYPQPFQPALHLPTSSQAADTSTGKHAQPLLAFPCPAISQEKANDGV